MTIAITAIPNSPSPVSLFLRDARTDMMPSYRRQDLEGKRDVTVAALSTMLIASTLPIVIGIEWPGGLFRRSVLIAELCH